MASVNNPHPRCLLVLTRDYSNTSSSGRERVVANIKNTLRAQVELIEFRLPNILERKKLLRWTAAIIHLLLSIARLRPSPLQSILFFDRRRIRELIQVLQNNEFDAIYFDGIRTIDYLRATRNAQPALHLICDFDDLMSLRMSRLANRRAGLSMGYLAARVPKIVRKLIGEKWIGGFITRYEQHSLARSELIALRTANYCVLVGENDAAHLLHRAPRHLRQRIVAIGPAVHVRRQIMTPLHPLRFVFIGSDALIQNQLTIDWLLRAWEHVRPVAPLHIYGRMSRQYGVVTNVYFHGFADTVDDVFTRHSILVAPAFLAGGVKTKILEAIELGCAVVGNALAFGGLPFDTNRFSFSERDILAIIQAPAPHIARILAASRDFQEQCISRLHPQKIQACWLNIMLPHIRHPESSHS